MNKITEKVKAILHSKLAWLLFVINLVIQINWVVPLTRLLNAAFERIPRPCLTMGEQMAAMYNPADIDVAFPPLVMIWEILSFPALLITGFPPFHLGVLSIITGKLFPNLCFYSVLNFQNASIPFITSIYWFSIGYFISKLLAKRKLNKLN